MSLLVYYCVDAAYVIGSSIVISRELRFKLSHLDAGHCISKQSHVVRIDEVLRFLLHLVNDSRPNCLK